MRKLAQVIRWKGIPKYVMANVDDKFYKMSYKKVYFLLKLLTIVPSILFNLKIY